MEQRQDQMVANLPGGIDAFNLNAISIQESSGVDDSPIQLQQPKFRQVTIGPHHFDLLKLIGEGGIPVINLFVFEITVFCFLGFGKVYLCRNKLTSELLAMKVISKKLLKKKNNVQYMLSEKNILSKMNHPFIVSLHHAFNSQHKLFLVMDFLSGGELFFHLKRRGLILEPEVRLVKV